MRALAARNDPKGIDDACKRLLKDKACYYQRCEQRLDKGIHFATGIFQSIGCRSLSTELSAKPGITGGGVPRHAKRVMKVIPRLRFSLSVVITCSARCDAFSSYVMFPACISRAPECEKYPYVSWYFFTV